GHGWGARLEFLEQPRDPRLLDLLDPRVDRRGRHHSVVFEQFLQIAVISLDLHQSPHRVTVRGVEMMPRSHSTILMFWYQSSPSSRYLVLAATTRRREVSPGTRTSAAHSPGSRLARLSA